MIVNVWSNVCRNLHDQQVIETPEHTRSVRIYELEGNFIAIESLGEMLQGFEKRELSWLRYKKKRNNNS